MSEHTPGPWAAQGETISCATGYVAFAACSPRTLDETRNEGESWLDMRVRTSGDRDELKMQVIANARLIAAAPDMLQAVEEFVEHFDSDTVERLFFINKAKAYRLGSALEQIRAAIAKAKGKQP